MITIIVKGTNGCNLACSYCSLGKKKSFRFVSKESLVNLMMFSCEYAKYQEESIINFILHGGEPTLIAPNIYDESITIIKEKYPELEIRISMQSNGLVITDQYINIIKKHDIHMGISLDGSECIHDAERRTVGNKPSFEKITNNIDSLLSAGVSVSCLMVLTKNALQEEFDYLEFFETRNLHLKINPLLNYGNVTEHPELILEEGEYARYLIDLYEEIVEKNINVIVSPIDDIINGIIHNQVIRECSFKKNCNKHFLCIDYKGCIYPCGKFSDMNEMCIGNIRETSYQKIDKFLREKLCERRNLKLPRICNSCKFLKLCNGGCSAEAMIDGDFNAVPIMCKDYKKIFEYFYGSGLRLLKETLIKQKQILEENK